jgi:hypothetical protein
MVKLHKPFHFGFYFPMRLRVILLQTAPLGSAWHGPQLVKLLFFFFFLLQLREQLRRES